MSDRGPVRSEPSQHHEPNSPIRIEGANRRVRVEVDGVTVADSGNAQLLHESNLPVRYYFPQGDVRMDLMTPTARATSCLHKGTARYWTASINGIEHENILWGYDTPLPGAEKIAGLVAFYNEKVDIHLGQLAGEEAKAKFS